MASHAMQQLVQIVDFFFENGRSVAYVFRKLYNIYVQHNHRNVKPTVKKCQRSGFVEDQRV